MNRETITRLTDKLSESPILRADSLPSAAEIDDASSEIGVPFSADYRDFLLTFGAAMVGPYPIYGLRPVEVMGDDSWSVVAMTKQFREDNVPEANEWVIVSADHAGNPVGMDRDGVIWIHDHDFGGVARVAKNFEDYVRVRCLGLEGV
jgi:hypothetical protein